MSRFTPIAILLLALLALPGCNVVGFLGEMPIQRTPAEYELAARPTLVMVEDPAGHAAHPRFPSVIGSHAAYELRRERVVPRTVSQRELTELASSLGSDAFSRLPIDELGRQLEAEQVIHVLVKSVQIDRHREMGLYRPRAQLEVKVIDAEAGRRLFPDPGRLSDPEHSRPGYELTVELEHHAADVPGRDVELMLTSELAEEAGRRVARLFYRHARDH